MPSQPSTAERGQKGRYVYYKCTGFRGDCPEGFYREEALTDQFAEIVRGIHLDREVVDWVKEALSQSLAEETTHHRVAIARLTQDLERVKRRMNQAYLDKLDGTITEEFWAEHAAEWQAEKARIIEQLARHEQADDQYLDTGIRVLELAERAHELYLQQDAANRRRLLSFVLAGCTLRGGTLTPTYRQPFDILVRMAAKAAEGGPSRRSSSKIANWGPYRDEFLTVLRSTQAGSSML